MPFYYHRILELFPRDVLFHHLMKLVEGELALKNVWDLADSSGNVIDVGFEG